jgi:ficolin
LTALTNSASYRLRIDLGDFSEQNRFAEYNNFVVDGAASNYRVTFSTCYFGNSGDSFIQHAGMSFSTYDVDNDKSTTQSCASVHQGGWWFNNCLQSNLNGLYNNTEHGKGITWNDWLGAGYSLRFTEMKIRSANY